MADNNNLDLIEIAVHGDIPSAGEMVNVFQFRLVCDVPVSDASLTSQVQSLMIGIFTTILPCANTSVHYTYAVITNTTQEREVGNALLSLAGQSGNDPLPAGIAAGITAYTGKPGKRGRKFIGGMVEDRTSAQYWTTSALAALAAWAAKWLQGIVWDNALKFLYPVVVSALTGVIHDFTSVSVQTVPAYQRSRKPNK